MTRVAIIGAGPCGLSQLRSFQQAAEGGADIPDIVCFERQDDWGGLWNYTWRTGTDEFGEPVHGSMYRYLWSNGPKECLEFADYSFDEHFGKPIPSFPPRAPLRDYIVGRADKSNVRDWVRFNQSVRDVHYDEDDNRFIIRSVHLPDNTDSEEAFDYLIVATGHFSVPHVPQFDGIDRFPGRVIHGHDFRDAVEFSGQRLLVIGASYSAEDIALQSLKYGAASVSCSYRTGPMGFRWPQGIEELPLVERFEGKTVHFSGGDTREIDAVVMCTGYLHHFPFLPEPLRLATHNRLYPGTLFKGVVWIDNPALMYLGMQDQYYTFSMFDAQAWYARDVILGRIELPSGSDMKSDAVAWQTREETLEDPIQEIDFQTDYCKDLCLALDYSLDWDLASDNFKHWEHHKEESIVGYRNKAFPSPVTGTKAPIHHTEWWEAMDDSAESFLG